jgi:uncharacterized protein
MNFVNNSRQVNRRIRDAVHGLIVFDHSKEIEKLAWKLLGIREFQRLRRIRQLGVSELTFPSAVHTRFVHSIGVFHIARKLIEVIQRELASDFQGERAEVALIAALLHDLGHGPFSHVFESVQKSRGVVKRHEQWTAELIRNPSGEIKPLLEEHRPGFTADVAELLEAENPVDIYHAVVSSSFDADRLEYLQRDRFMTGSGAGAIDFDWLMDNLRVAEVSLEAPDEDEGEDEDLKVPTFCLAMKALPAAEQFLLARHTLHEQVYFHKTTRCAQKMVGKLLRRIAKLATGAEAAHETGLPLNHPLLRFYQEGSETLAAYLDLDDSVVLGALSLMTHARDALVQDLALRIQSRRLYKTMDVGEFGSDPGRQAQKVRDIEQHFEQAIQGESVIKDDEAALNIYSVVGGDEERIHKRLHILDAMKPKEISELSPIIKALNDKKMPIRFFFEKQEDRDQARTIRRERHAKP